MTREQTIAVLHASGCNEAEVIEALAVLPQTTLFDHAEVTDRDTADYVAAALKVSRADVLDLVENGETLAALYGRRAA